MRTVLLLVVAFLLPAPSYAGYDHQHQPWNELLRRHVVVIGAGKASRVSYAGFARDRAKLRSYLDSVSQVTPQEYGRWSESQQLAFLINAYNAFTIEKILTRYPDLRSIRDFGTFIGNPWKDRFFTLLGKKQSLDGIEHDLIRAPGAFEDPRIHFAVNCASIGCPMLREEAYVASRLDRQLDEQALRFLSDRSRNRFNPQTGRLEVSSIFDWYGRDFSRGWKGYPSVEAFLAAHADKLADAPEPTELIRGQKAGIVFLDYDWGLNDAK
jgi:hypothetical protein